MSMNNLYARSSVCLRIPTNHQRLGQDVFNEFEVTALKLLVLGAGSLRLLIRVEAKELGVVLELTLFQDWGVKKKTAPSDQKVPTGGKAETNSSELNVSLQITQRGVCGVLASWKTGPCE